MVGKAQTEDFIRRAEELNANLGSTALWGTEKFLDASQWLRRCETRTLFYIKFYNQVERSLEFLLANPKGERPAILEFLTAHDLEKNFAPIELRPAAFSSVSTAYGHLTATIKYILARLLTTPDFGEPAPFRSEPEAKAAFEALWTLLEVAEYKEKWQAYEAILILASGSFGRFIELYEREYRFDVTKHETSHRTVIKACYLLSQLAAGGAGDNVAFAAVSYINILKLDYYLWRVNDNASAEMELIPLVVLCLLYERVVRGYVSSQHDFYASLAPRAVVETLETLRIWQG